MLFIVYLLSIFFFFFFFFSSRRRHTRCSRDWSSDVCSSDLLFPPGAYHSEGHQDSMGVCRYLALMKRSEEHTSELQSRLHLVCRLLLEKKKKPERPHLAATQGLPTRTTWIHTPQPLLSDPRR